MAESLADKTCVPCKGGVPPLDAGAIAFLIDQLDGWDVVEQRRLTKRYRFADFAGALAFVNRVGAIAEEQGHHPNIYLAWGEVLLEVWTHKINGLTESDFILAAKCDRAISPL
jgi:4a-hydroxytetrahydrobiopterin dehydratase